MNLQLKQKIIGIVVIAIFLAIAIPFLFSGSKNQHNNASSTPAATNNEPLKLPPSQQPSAPDTAAPALIAPEQANNNVKDINVGSPASQEQTAPTIEQGKTNVELPNNIANNQPQPTPSIPNTLTTTTSKTTTAASNTTVTDSVKNTNTNQNPALHDSLAQKENNIIGAAASHKAVKIHKTKTPKIAAKKLTKEKINTEPTSSNAKKQWLVHVGIYHDLGQAQRLLKKLETDNYHATIQTVKIKGKTLNRVILEPVPNKEKAESLAKRVAKNFQIKTKVVEEQVVALDKHPLKKSKR